MIEQTNTQQTTKETSLIIQDGNKDLCLNINSISPSIKESERFIYFLNDRFNLNLNLEDLTILIQETKPSIKGFFMPSLHLRSFKTDEEKKLNTICLSSHTLKQNPYETLTHELAHYIDLIKNNHIPKSNYHNKNFKLIAEKLLLKVEKGIYGYCYTSETDEFKQLLKEFKPSLNAFKIFQQISQNKKKDKSRLLLFMCECGTKIRSAKNENKPLKAICLYCNSEFKQIQ